MSADRPVREIAGGDELARVEADIARARARVATSVLALRGELTRQTDWRAWVARYPLASVAAAFAAGLWLGRRRR